VLTKIGGMKHVWMYYTQYRNVSAEDAKKEHRSLRAVSERHCMQCHSTTDALWGAVPDHRDRSTPSVRAK